MNLTAPPLELEVYDLRGDLSGEIADELIDSLADLARRSFRLDEDLMPLCRQWLQSSLGRGSYLIASSCRRACIFATLPEKTLLGRRFLWADGACVDPALQDQKMSVRLVLAALDLAREEPFGWLGSRTQNQLAVRGNARYGYTRPVHGPYTDEQGRHIVSYLSEEIGQLEGLTDFDVETGVWRGALGHAIVSEHESIARHMEGADPRRGDALVCVCRLDPEKVEHWRRVIARASAAGQSAAGESAAAESA